jgi:hypothetical protein
MNQNGPASLSAGAGSHEGIFGCRVVWLDLRQTFGRFEINFVNHGLVQRTDEKEK